MPYLTRLIKKIAPQLGAKVVLEPEWGSVGQIIYPNGIVRSFHFYSLDLNNMASSKMAKDKEFAKIFMKKAGYPVAEGTSIFEKNWAKAVKSNRDILYAPIYAHTLGYPLIVKPNNKSQGLNVALVSNDTELRRALAEIFKDDKVAVLERYLPGRDYRVVVLDGKVISAYERIALSVTGDGVQSIAKLLTVKQEIFKTQGRDTVIDFSDRRIRAKLARDGYTLKTILPKGKKIFLLDNANLSTGGDALDVTNTIHKEFKKIAVEVTKKMGLRMAGVDIMVRKGDITQAPTRSNYYIIEINAAPGLDHYVTIGDAQKKIVEDMYVKVFKALGKKD